MTLFVMGFPIVVVGGWLALCPGSETSDTTVRLAVTGFDPHQVQAGHSLTYTVDYGPAGDCPRDGASNTPQTCVCLSENATMRVHQATWAGPCTVRPLECPVYIEGECNAERFTANIEQFHLPDAVQTAPTVIPGKSTIHVVVKPGGQAVVTGFAADGVHLLEHSKPSARSQ